MDEATNTFPDGRSYEHSGTIPKNAILQQSRREGS